jgi:2-oxoisovalerate dehydrogenase E2 component (dihydrolipoyl transacylase)
MSELRQFKLPDVGEGLTEADIVKWHVQPGDTVIVNQIIVEIETAKAVVELPSPHAGTVSSLLVAEGDTVDVGTPIISVDTGPPDDADGHLAQGKTGQAKAGQGQGQGQAARDQTGAGRPQAGGLATPEPLQTSTSADLVPPPPAEAIAESDERAAPPKEERQAVLVGYGVKLGTTKRRTRKPAAERGPAAPAPAQPEIAQPATPQPHTTQSAAAQPAAAQPAAAQPAAAQPAAAQPATAHASRAALAKPPVRKLARDLGVDLAALTGTGPNGSITRDDVQSATSIAERPGATMSSPEMSGSGAGRSTGSLAALSALPREERMPIKGVRKHTAAAMTASAFTAPHVTMFLQIDITQTMAATAQLKTLPDFADIRVSPLLLVAKALLIAAGRHPMINAAWDEAAQEIVVRHYVNLGIAAATERGLVVPSIKDAHALSLPDLARALGELAESARAGKSTPADLTGGTISITNVGVFGIDTGTPILPPGETAILAFGQVKDAPWVHGGELAVRKVCTLGMSFDHRVVDGDLGSAVLRDVGAMLTDPLRMLAWS